MHDLEGELTVEIGVDGILEKSSGPKVDKFELEGLRVDEQVLVLDVPVDHPLPVARQHRLHNLKSRVLPEVGKLSRFKVFSGFSGERSPGGKSSWQGSPQGRSSL